ncbi:hypothetical protein [Anaerocolumna jejuensis]|uniref:hypothetical protein n=1 Tax=Anaerocolumna jejuensis TaxID=259063 RepID=UPI003F7CBEDC
MKTVFKRLGIFLCAVVLFAISTSVPTYAAEEGTRTEVTLLDMLSGTESNYQDNNAVITVKDSTKENYLKSIEGNGAVATDIQTQNVIQPRVADEVVKYKTLTSTSSIKGTSISTTIGVEIQYLYSNVTRKAIQILGVGTPYIRVAGSLTNATFDNAGPNISWDSSSVRISFTGSTLVGVSESVGYSLGVEGFSFSYSASGTYYYYSPVVTQVANFYLSQLY